MAYRNYKNFCRVTVSTGYDAAAVSIVLTTGHGANCPDAPFNAVWYNSTDYPDPTDDPNVEVIKVTARSTDTLTIIRAQEGSTASTKNTSAKTYKLVVGVTVQTLSHDTVFYPGDPRKAPALSTFSQQLETTSYAGYGTLDGALSGFTYNALRDTIIFTDQSSTAGLGQLKELDANGTLIRTIDLTNFQDVECLTWMYGTTYALGEENLSASPFSRVTLCNISDVATSFDRTAGTSYDMAPLGDLNNLSIEGITYDPDRNLLYLIMEKSTTQGATQQTTGIWMVWSLDPTNGLIRPVCDLLQSVGVANVAWDLSDCYYDRNSQRLYIASHEGTTGATGPGKVVAVDICTGKVVDSMTIDSTLTQAEAITFSSAQHKIYLRGQLISNVTLPVGTQQGVQPTPSTHRVCIGTAEQTNGTTRDGQFNGYIDEVRISDVRRSATWVAATSETLEDSYNTYGSEEQLVQGTLDQTLGAATLSADGTVTASGPVGTLNVTLGAVTADTDVDVEVAAALDQSLGAVTSTTDVDVEVAATLDQTLGAVTSTTDADVEISGSLDQTLGAATLSSDVDVVATATLDQTLGAVTITADADAISTGTLSQTLGSLSITADASVEIAASLSQTLGAVTSTSDADVEIAATLDQTLGAVTSTTDADVEIAASLDQTLGTLTLSADGTVGAAPVSGDLSQTLGAVTSTTDVDVEVAASLSQTLGAVTSTADASAEVSASLSQTLGAVTSTTDVDVVATGSLSQTLGTLTSTTDADVVGGDYQNLTLYSNVTFHTTNRLAGRARVISLFVTASGADRTITCNSSWKLYGTNLTFILPSGKEAYMSLLSNGPDETNVRVSYSHQQN